MTTAHLANWFIRNRGVSEVQAARMADAVVLRRRLKAEKLRKAHERNQFTIPFDELQSANLLPPNAPDEPVDF